MKRELKGAAGTLLMLCTLGTLSLFGCKTREHNTNSNPNMMRDIEKKWGVTIGERVFLVVRGKANTANDYGRQVSEYGVCLYSSFKPLVKSSQETERDSNVIKGRHHRFEILAPNGFPQKEEVRISKLYAAFGLLIIEDPQERAKALEKWNAITERDPFVPKGKNLAKYNGYKDGANILQLSSAAIAKTVAAPFTIKAKFHDRRSGQIHATATGLGENERKMRDKDLTQDSERIVEMSSPTVYAPHEKVFQNTKKWLEEALIIALRPGFDAKLPPGLEAPEMQPCRQVVELKTETK